MAQDRRIPAQLSGDGPGPGVDQQLGGIEPMAGLRVVGSVDPIAVELTRAESLDRDRPEVAPALHRPAGGRAAVTGVEAHLRPGGVT